MQWENKSSWHITKKKSVLNRLDKFQMLPGVVVRSCSKLFFRQLGYTYDMVYIKMCLNVMPGNQIPANLAG